MEPIFYISALESFLVLLFIIRLCFFSPLPVSRQGDLLKDSSSGEDTLAEAMAFLAKGGSFEVTDIVYRQSFLLLSIKAFGRREEISFFTELEVSYSHTQHGYFDTLRPGTRIYLALGEGNQTNGDGMGYISSYMVLYYINGYPVMNEAELEEVWGQI